MEEVVVCEAAEAAAVGIAGGAAAGTGRAEPAVDDSPVVPAGAGEAVGGVGAGGAAGVAGVAEVVYLVKPRKALSAESVAVDLEAAGTDDAPPRVKKSV